MIGFVELLFSRVNHQNKSRMELKVTKELLKLLLQFRCPYCQFANYDAPEMQDHIVKCGQIKIESDLFKAIKIEPEEMDLATRIKAILSDNYDDTTFSPNYENIADLNHVNHIETEEFSSVNLEDQNKNEVEDFHFISCDVEPESEADYKDPDSLVDSQTKEVESEPKIIKFSKLNKLPFDCKKCDKSYSTKSSLQMHIKIAHLGLRYKCKKCKKVYKSQGNFKNGNCFSCSKKSTKGIKNNQITKTFKQSKTPKKNKKTDSKTKTSKNSGTEFFFKNNFFMITTKKGSKYECSECKSKFSTEGHLAEHFNRIHRKLNFQCKVCNFKFRPFSKCYEKSLLKYYEAKAQHANCSKRKCL